MNMKKQIVTILGIVAFAAASANAAVTISIANPVDNTGNVNLTTLASAGNVDGDWQAYSTLGYSNSGEDNWLRVIQKDGGTLLRPTRYAEYLTGDNPGPQNYNWTDAAATGFSAPGVGSQISGVFWDAGMNRGTPFEIGLYLAYADTTYTINLFAGHPWAESTLTATFGAQTVSNTSVVPEEYGRYVITASTGADDSGLLTLSFNSADRTRVDAIAVSASTVPEPSTGALLGFGLGGLVMTRLIRRKQS